MIDPVMLEFGNIKCIVRLETVSVNNAVKLYLYLFTTYAAVVKN